MIRELIPPFVKSKRANKKYLYVVQVFSYLLFVSVYEMCIILGFEIDYRGLNLFCQIFGLFN